MNFPVLLKEDTPQWSDAEELINADATSQLLWISGLRPQHQGRIIGVAQHPNRSMIASVSIGDLGIQLWDTESGKKVGMLETRIQSSPLASTEVTAIEFSPDGKYLVAASDQIEVFSLDDKGRFTSVQGNLPQARRSIASMSFSSDGEMLALGDQEGMLYLWRDWKSLGDIPKEKTFEVHGAARINSLAFHPSDNHLLAVGGNRGGAVSLINTQTHDIERLEPVEKHGPPNLALHSLAFSPDGQLLAVGGESVPVTVWNVSERKPVTTLLEEEWRVISDSAKEGSKSLRMVCPSVAFSPDGKRLAVSWHHQASDGEILYYPKSVTVFGFDQDSETPVRLTDIPTDDGPFQHVLFDHQDDVLFLSRAGRLESWDLLRGCPTQGEPASHSARIESLAFSRDGLLFASGDVYGTIRIWNAQTGKLRHTLRKHWGRIKSLKFSIDGSRLFANGFRDRMITAWDVSSGELIEPTLHFEKPIFRFDLTADGRTMIAGGWYDKFFTYDPETFVLKDEIKISRGSAPIITPGGKQIIALNNGKSASSLDLYEWEKEGSLTIVNQWSPLHDSLWVDAEIHPDGSLMVIVFGDGTAKTFRRQRDRSWLESSQVMLPFRSADITQVHFDPQGRRLVTGNYSGQTKIWDVKSEQLLEVLPGNVQITSLMTSPNGELLLTGNMEGMIHAWATKEQQPAPVVVGTQSAPHPLLKGARDIALASERRLLFSIGTNAQLTDVIAWHLDDTRLTRAYTLTGRETQPALWHSVRMNAISSPVRRGVEGELMLWDLDTGESRQLARVLASPNLVFSPDGKTIAGVGTSGPDAPSRISLWDVAKGGDAIAATPLLPAPAIGITFTADGSQLISAVAAEGHPVQFWDIDPETRALSLAKEFPAPPHKALKLTLNQAGTHLAVAFAGGGGWIWDLSKSSELPSEVISDGGLYCMAFGPDDRLLATGGFLGHLRVYDNDAPRNVIVSESDGVFWDVVTDLIFDRDGQTLYACKTDGTITPWKVGSAKSTVPAVDYLRLFDLDEATGDLVWNDRQTMLSPPTQNMVFARNQIRYLSELNGETDLKESQVRLFEAYLSSNKFLAAEGLMLSMEPEAPSDLREQLTERLAMYFINLQPGENGLECNLELASRLFEAHPNLFSVRLARCTQLQRWSEADALLMQDLQKVSAADKKRHVQHFFAALDAQITSLVEKAEPVDENDSTVPPRRLLLASTLSDLSKSLDDAMASDVLRGFSAEVETPPAESLLDRFLSEGWKNRVDAQ